MTKPLKLLDGASIVSHAGLLVGRSVSKEEKAFALGLQYVVMRLFGKLSCLSYIDDCVCVFTIFCGNYISYIFYVLYYD